ncbi:MAG: hypothetical protein LBQ22_12780 [Bacteroidales bacterium]|jgi:hypothetical protein|nr:hypothetical protein [Bacteroidales bacterium]
MKKYYSLLLIVVISSVFFTSCDPKETESEYEIVNIEEDIKSETQWAGGKIYVIKKNDFRVENTLTIGAGSIIKFTSNAGNMTVINGAKIIARGSSGSPIVFTSIKDDGNGGDTNGDGGGTSPAAGDWNSITLVESSGSEFINCKFMYGGRNDGLKQNAALDISTNSSAIINNCTFAYNGGKFDKNNCVGALHTINSNYQNTEITGNIFYSNELPLTINAEKDLNNSNSFSYNGYTNKYNGIFVDGIRITKNTTWQEDEVAFVILSNNLVINSGIKLTLANKAVLKFLEDGMLDLIDGGSALVNHDGSGVYFTSFKDDAHGGDSNGNGNIDENELSQENYYDWYGVYTGGQKNSNYASWPNILYANPNPPEVKKAI